MKPKLLLIRPYAGHTSKIMDRTIKTLSQDFDVDMPEIPHETFEEYVNAVNSLLKCPAPYYDKIVGICQGGVGIVSALLIPSIDIDIGRVLPPHKKIVLISSPIDTSVESLVSASIKAVGADLLTKMYSYKGRVSGALLTASYMSLDIMKHIKKLSEYPRPKKTQEFYDMYFDTEDMSQEFFRSSINISFIDNKLIRQQLGYRVANMQFMTVEGTKDDITAVGQTAALFNLLPPGHKKTSLVVEAGHYGCFSGSTFDNVVYPKIKEFLLGD